MIHNRIDKCRRAFVAAITRGGGSNMVGGLGYRRDAGKRRATVAGRTGSRYDSGMGKGGLRPAIAPMTGITVGCSRNWDVIGRHCRRRHPATAGMTSGTGFRSALKHALDMATFTLCMGMRPCQGEAGFEVVELGVTFCRGSGKSRGSADDGETKHQYQP